MESSETMTIVSSANDIEIGQGFGVFGGTF
jgi:hypothetical protein